MSTLALNQDINPNSHKAQRFTAWLATISISMSFAGLTSYYIVRKSKGDWMEFPLPSIFWTSTIVLLLSSMALYMAHLANKKNNTGTLKLGLGLTFLLGVAFCIFQWLGWQQLLSQGVFVSGGNISGSIFYVITGGHALHVVGGLFFLLIANIRAFWLFDRKRKSDTHMFRDSDKLWVRTDLISVYWHFMGVLWLYLFIFLNVQ